MFRFVFLALFFLCFHSFISCEICYSIKELPPTTNYQSSFASMINDRGEVIGGMIRKVDNYKRIGAFFYDEGGLHPLNINANFEFYLDDLIKQTNSPYSSIKQLAHFSLILTDLDNQGYVKGFLKHLVHPELVKVFDWDKVTGFRFAEDFLEFEKSDNLYLEKDMKREIIHVEPLITVTILAENNQNQRVGYKMISDLSVQDNSLIVACLWTEEKGWQNLSDLIEPKMEWESLVIANSINNQGQIVGWGWLKGKMRGFVLTPFLP